MSRDTSESDSDLSSCHNISDNEDHIQKRKRHSKESKKHKCDYEGCEKTFNRPDRLEAHKRLHKGQRPFICSFVGCDKAYTNASHLKRHVKVFHDKFLPVNSFRCPEQECGAVLVNKQCLKKHIKRRHTDLPYECPDCKKRFKRNSQLIEHSYFHTLVEPYKCEVCEKGFRKSCNLKRHQRCHQTYNCRLQNCSETFKSMSLYRKHMASVHKPGSNALKLNLKTNIPSVSTEDKENEVVSVPEQKKDQNSISRKVPFPKPHYEDDNKSASAVSTDLKRFVESRDVGKNKPHNLNDELKLMGNPHQERTQSSSSESSSETSPSFTHFSLDSNSYDNVIPGSPFDGFCIHFLRHSTNKEHENHHHCQLKHEVPDLLNEILHKWNCICCKEELIRRTSEVIKRVCCNCTNPPLWFLVTIVKFCVKLKQNYTMLIVLRSLKKNITVNAVGNKKYVEVWSRIAKALVTNLGKHDENPAGPINIFLQSIVHDGIESNKKSNSRVLYLTLQHLAMLARTRKSPTLKLLNCVDFLGNHEYNVYWYPFSFIEAVLEQVIAKPKNCNNPEHLKSLVFKVYKTLFYKREPAKYIWNKNSQLTEEYLRIAKSILPVSNQSRPTPQQQRSNL